MFYDPVAQKRIDELQEQLEKLQHLVNLEFIPPLRFDKTEGYGAVVSLDQNNTTIADVCHAIKDECTGTTFYMRITSGIISLSGTPCDECGGNPDPPPTLPCCGGSSLLSSMCLTTGTVDVSAAITDDNYGPFLSGQKITLTLGPSDPQGATWSGTGPLDGHGSFFVCPYYCVFSGKVGCTNYNGVIDIGEVRWVTDTGVSYFTKYTEPGVVTCDPFSITRNAQIWKYLGGFGSSNPPFDTGMRVTISVTAGSCPSCTTLPTVTTTTTSIPGSSTYVTITGTGFSTTPSANLVTFNLGYVGHVVASTTTSLTVLITTHSGNLGNLFATVTVEGCTSNNAQVATLIAPATGIEIIGLYNSGETVFPLTVPAGKLIVLVAQYGTASTTAPTVTYDGSAMTLDADQENIFGPPIACAIYAFSLTVSAGSGNVGIVPPAGVYFNARALIIKGLASNALDRTASAYGNASAPDTGATAATTAADEGAIGAFATINEGSNNFTAWLNNFVSGGGDIHSTPLEFEFVLVEGRRILSSTGTVQAAVTPSNGGICYSWAGVVVTYK